MNVVLLFICAATRLLYYYRIDVVPPFIFNSNTCMHDYRSATIEYAAQQGFPRNIYKMFEIRRRKSLFYLDVILVLCHNILYRHSLRVLPHIAHLRSANANGPIQQRGWSQEYLNTQYLVSSLLFLLYYPLKRTMTADATTVTTTIPIAVHTDSYDRTAEPDLIQRTMSINSHAQRIVMSESLAQRSLDGVPELLTVMANLEELLVVVNPLSDLDSVGDGDGEV